MAIADEQLTSFVRAASLVTDSGRLAGIFIERDVFDAGDLPCIDFEGAAIRDYTGRDPLTLVSDSSIPFVLKRMLIEGIRNIALVYAQGRPTGVVSYAPIDRRSERLLQARRSEPAACTRARAS